MARDSLRLKYNLSKAEINQLLTQLATLQRQAKKGTVRQPTSGICANWMILGYGGAVGLLCDLAMRWKYSVAPGESVAYPVPFTPHLGNWEGAHLEYRLDLIRYLRHRLRDWRRRATH